jgi:MarR family transcriptional regulator, organic hydroperoxide resistance regulator
MLPADHMVELIDRLRRLNLERNPVDEQGLSPAQMLLLLWVGRTPGCRLQRVAEGLELTPPTVSVGVRRLEKAGLLRRQPDPQDQRAICLFLTQRGQDLYAEICAYRCRKMAQALAALTPSEQITLLELLGRGLDAAEQAQRMTR